MADQSNQQPQVGRQVFNANLDITNITTEREITEIMLKTFDYIAKTLEDHCGPYGGFAIINDPLHPIEEPIFTKDGINIVRNLEFASPMQEFVKRNLAYVGSRMEAIAGDGTTSAMMIVAVALRELIVRLRKTKETYSYKMLITEFDSFVKALSNIYKKKIWTLDSICRRYPDLNRDALIRWVAGNQAYTSSHGDHDVASAIVEIFTTTPESAWDYMFLTRERFETDQRVKVVIDETQYTISNCTLYRNDQLTEDMGTKCIRADVPFIVSSFPLGTADFTIKQLMERIYTAIKSDEELVVLAPDLTDNTTRDKLDELANANPNNRVAIFYVDVQNPKVNDLVLIRLLMGDSLNAPYHEGKADISFDGATLEIDGLYANPTGATEHPYSKDKKTYAVYNAMLDYITKVIEEQQKDVATAQSNYYLEAFKKFHNKLFLTRRVFVKIGGTAHDNVSTVDVLMDSILATRHSLKKGFVLGGNRTLAVALEECIGTLSKDNELWSIYGKSLLVAIESVFAAALKPLKSKKLRKKKITNRSFDLLNPHLPEINLDKIFANNFTNIVSDAYGTTYTTSDTELSYGVIIQPSTVDLEIVKRFGEFALKFACSRKIVTPGGVVLNHQKTPK